MKFVKVIKILKSYENNIVLKETAINCDNVEEIYKSDCVVGGINLPIEIVRDELSKQKLHNKAEIIDMKFTSGRVISIISPLGIEVFC